MPSPRRRPLTFTGDLSPESLDRMTWAQMSDLAGRGLISWGDANASLSRRVKAANGGRDPYAHLRGQWELGTLTPSAAPTNGKVR